MPKRSARELKRLKRLSEFQKRRKDVYENDSDTTALENDMFDEIETVEQWFKIANFNFSFDKKTLIEYEKEYKGLCETSPLYFSRHDIETLIIEHAIYFNKRRFFVYLIKKLRSCVNKSFFYRHIIFYTITQTNGYWFLLWLYKFIPFNRLNYHIRNDVFDVISFNQPRNLTILLQIIKSASAKAGSQEDAKLCSTAIQRSQKIKLTLPIIDIGLIKNIYALDRLTCLKILMKNGIDLNFSVTMCEFLDDRYKNSRFYPGGRECLEFIKNFEEIRFREMIKVLPYELVRLCIEMMYGCDE
jgi:hypothetical protein